MIDLDPSLRDAKTRSSGWTEERAIRIARHVVDAVDVETDYEPPDEEWIRFLGEGSSTGMVSVRVPLAIVTPDIGAILHSHDHEVIVVPANDFSGEIFRASAVTLRGTVLPLGWNFDFDTEAFSANDLFVESV